jgi:aspartyl-tRNA(Asn)/glutamyl-tRNA(Gln) amidotransferase subunit A
MPLTEAVKAVKSKKVSAVELTRASLGRIAECKELNNFITVCAESALAAAAEADKKIALGGDPGPLAGVPVAVKDNISTKGIRTTCASKFLQNYVPPFDASVVTALRNAGASIVGKTNMDEFAMGSGSENSYFGAVKNFRERSRVAGGSSGGSANAVAACEVFAALGSDTGGSIRQPAAYCGVAGLKPTYSLVSRYGLIAFASSLDQIGPLGRTVRDCALMLDVLAFADPRDSTSVPRPQKTYSDFVPRVKGKRIGIAKEFFPDTLNADVRKRLNAAVAALEGAGAVVKETSIKSFNAALATYYVLSSAEAASNLARFDGIKYGYSDRSGDGLTDIYFKSRTGGFGDEVKRRIMTGNYVLSSGYYDAYYLKASKVRTLIKREYEDALRDCDALICPTAPSSAFKAGKKTSDHTQVYLEDVYTVPVNIAGLPALSVPCGTDGGGMPIGMQLIGKAFDEKNLFELAGAFEEITGGNADV